MIEDCVRSHRAWMTRKALSGGQVGRSGAVDWAFVAAESTMHVLFPPGPTRADLADAVAMADTLGAASVALWCAGDHALPEIAGLGFERGWQPWWMEADLTGERMTRASIVQPSRVRLATRTRPHDNDKSALVGQPDVYLAEGEVHGRYAGRAWMLVTDTVAGIYDMAVWPAFRRRGIGRDLLTALAGAAESCGVERLTLNATPEGATLYASWGFDLLGAGRTYWRHRAG